MKQAPVVLGFLGVSILGGLIGTWMYDFLLPASVPFLPLVPIALYYVVVVLVSTLYALGLVLGACLLVKGGWRILSSREQRAAQWGKIKNWPNSKWDALSTATFSFCLGVMAVLGAAAFVLPKGGLVGVIAPEEGASIIVPGYESNGCCVDAHASQIVGRRIKETQKSLDHRHQQAKAQHCSFLWDRCCGRCCTCNGPNCRLESGDVAQTIT